MIDDTKLRLLIAEDEGQYHDRKSLLEGPPGQKRPRDRKVVRDQIAEYVASFANAEGGVLICGVENDGTITGHRYPSDQVDTMLQVPATRNPPPATAIARCRRRKRVAIRTTRPATAIQSSESPGTRS